MFENPVLDSLPLFYLGAVTPKGYIWYGKHLKNASDGWRTYFLKGCPGCGKSRFLEKLANELSLHYENTELISCSARQGSLDGIILHDAKVNILDGSYPHTADPQIPCGYDRLILLEQPFQKLSDAVEQEILFLWEAIRENLRQCQRFLKAAAALLEDSCQIAANAVDFPKIQKFAQRFSAREIPPSQFGQGAEHLRFFSAFTKDGILSLEQTPLLLCGQIICIKDDWGAASKEVLSALRQEFLAKGYDIFTCMCPLFPDSKIDHLFIPELGLCFLTQNKFHQLEILPDKTIHAQRFTDTEQLQKSHARLAWNKKAAEEMLSHVYPLLEENLLFYHRLHTYGKEAADPQKNDQQLYFLLRFLLENCPPL